MSENRGICVGIDVQFRRPCAIAVLDAEPSLIDSASLEGCNAEAIAEEVVKRLSGRGISVGDALFGIDAPRRPLKIKRPFYWDRAKASWRPRRPSERGWGRHCEVIISSCGIANPQWTPNDAESPDWMQLGYALFREFERIGGHTHEVFPSASYRLLAGQDHPRVPIDFSAFSRGPKDMLDACVAALTLHEFRAGRGTAVGDDGLGQIVLPRPLPEGISPVLLTWPKEG